MIPTATAPQNGTPSTLIAPSMKNAGSITNSPWAKLIVCEVCHSKREADRDQRVDAAGREPRDEELDEVGH